MAATTPGAYPPENEHDARSPSDRGASGAQPAGQHDEPHQDAAPGPDTGAEDSDDSQAPAGSGARTLRLLAAVCLVVVIALTVLAFLWSMPPDSFEVASQTETMTGRARADLAPGAHTTASIIGVANALLEKPGGYLRNDIAPPTVLLDNMPSWERGVVMEMRDTVRALRDDFSRAQTQSPEDPDLIRADAQFHFSDTNWILPATEDEFEKGVAALQSYLDRLHADGNARARFYVRADNLNFYLATVEKRLGAYAQRLAGNVFDWNLRGPEAAKGETSTTTRGLPATPWVQVDNVFFEARGYIWALLHTLRAIEQDFSEVMTAKGADGPLRQIIRKLEETQATVWSPVILNNSGFGLLTNHSLVMASYISRANAAIIDLRLLISEG